MPLVDQPERIGRSNSWSAVMTYGHQPSNEIKNEPTPPFGGSGVKPPPSSDAECSLAIYKDHIARLQEESASWRRVAERLEAEKAVASARVASLEAIMRSARHAAMGGNATKGTAELLRWIAHRWDIHAVEVGSPSKHVILDRASMLDAADKMMRAALLPEEKLI